jgi:hypothetical protein
MIFTIKKIDNCIISFCGWFKLQITLFGIKMNLKIPMVNLIYKSFPGVIFR